MSKIIPDQESPEILIKRRHTKPAGIPHICHMHHMQVQVSKFSGWCQKIPQKMFFYHHHHFGGGRVVVVVLVTTNTLCKHHHSTTTTTTNAIKISCVAIYAVLLQNKLFPIYAGNGTGVKT